MNRVPLRAFLMLLGLVSFTLPIQAQVSFFQPPTYAGSSQIETYIASGDTFVADFNSDGKPDILTSDGTMNLGNGDGTFSAGTSVPGGVLAVGDFNGDGRPDILEQSTGTLLVLLGKGDGTFQAPISTPSGASLSSLSATDLNGDGKADVIGVFNGSLMVYLSNGDGTFRSGVAYSLGSLPANVYTILTLGDFNGDGKTDVAVFNPVTYQEIVLLGNGDGTFQAAKTSAVTTAPGVFAGQFAAVGDFNGDGKLDLAITRKAIDSGPLASVEILPGNGDGTFGAPATTITLGGTDLIDLNVTVADLNGDGKPDLVVGGSSYSVEVYLGNGDFTFSSISSYLLGFPSSFPTLPSYATGTDGMIIADFNLDGKPDIAAAGSILLGNGDGTFQSTEFARTPEVNPPVAADFAKKGTLYLAMGATAGDLAVTIVANNGKGVLSVSQNYSVPSTVAYADGVVASDFNGDGNLDLLVMGYDTVSYAWGYAVLLGIGDGTFQSPVAYPQSLIAMPDAYPSTVVADFNNDGKMDIASSVTANGNQSLVVLLGNGDGTFSAPVYYYDGGAEWLTVADFNGDGKPDIAAGIRLGGTALLLGNGDGTFQNAIFPTSLKNFAAQYTTDLNNDGKADLLSSGQPVYFGQVALGNGDGTFTVLPPLSNELIVAVGDLNGDRKQDLLVQTLSPSDGTPQGNAVQLGNGDGTFDSPIPLFSGSGLLPMNSLIADMNGDGRPDIITPGPVYSGGPVSGIAVVFNTTPPSFELYATPISPSPVTVGSSATSTINVLSNFGFNTSVALSCAGLPTGASCTFNPPSIANASGKSALAIITTASTPAGTYPIQIKGGAGTLASSAVISLVVQATADFSLGAAPGTPATQTVSAGQTASFSLDVTPAGAFTGTVNFNCAITPSVNPAPVCNVPASVEVSGRGAQSVSISVATTSAATALWHRMVLPPSALPFLWFVLLSGTVCLWTRDRKRIAALAVPIVTLSLMFLPGCGGGSSSHKTGTPAGTYTVTVTASSGALSHSTVLQVVVQ